jgi:hypothetical protein
MGKSTRMQFGMLYLDDGQKQVLQGSSSQTKGIADFYLSTAEF